LANGTKPGGSRLTGLRCSRRPTAQRPACRQPGSRSSRTTHRGSNPPERRIRTAQALSSFHRSGTDPRLASSLGLLDASGAAQPTFTLPALSDPALAGLVVEHAVVVLNADLAPPVVSSPAAITLIP
jgi:hypothetical protein